MHTVSTSSPKHVIVLFGPKGAGKSTIGHFLSVELGIHFLRVEPLFLEVRERYGPSHPDFEQLGFQSVARSLQQALSRYGTVCMETTGASRHVASLIAELRCSARVSLIRVLATPEQCTDRIHTRDSSLHIPVSDDQVERINVIASQVVLPWAAVIDNTGAFPAQLIARTVRDLLASDEHGRAGDMPKTGG